MSTRVAQAAVNTIIRTCAVQCALTRNETMPEFNPTPQQRSAAAVSLSSWASQSRFGQTHPMVPEQGWQQIVKPSKRADNLFDLRVWRNGRVVNREGLTAEQVATFDCEAEWVKGQRR